MDTLYIVLISVAAAAILMFIAWFIWFSNNKITTTRYLVETEKRVGKDGKARIVHVSDLHGKSFGKDNKKLVELIKNSSPDVIVITGDVIHKYNSKNISVALTFVSSLRAIAPVLFVAGNHEMRKINYRSFRALLTSAGVIVLDNAVGSACGIVVAGLNAANLRNNSVYSLTDENTRKNNFCLLLAHEPQYLAKYARAGYDLVLSGHAHGGQWRVPFTQIGTYAPGQGLFPKLSSGQHMCGGTRMIISRGLGNSEFPLRLFNRPELVIIDLETK